MKRYKLSKAGVNATEGIARFNGDKEAYEGMLLAFKDDPYFGKLDAALAAGEVGEAFAAAHALKGIVGNLSMTRLFDDIQPMVETLRAGSLEGTGEQMATFERDYREVLEAIEG